MAEEINNLENLRAEYFQVNQNYRHFNNWRLTMVGLYFIIFLVALVFTFSQFRMAWGTGANQPTNFRLLWSFFTVAFLSFDIYFELNIRQLQKTAKELEESLNLRQFKALATPERNWLSYSVWGVYAIFLLFWLIAGKW